jgi:hypothetical protein
MYALLYFNIAQHEYLRLRETWQEVKYNTTGSNQNRCKTGTEDQARCGRQYHKYKSGETGITKLPRPQTRGGTNLGANLTEANQSPRKPGRERIHKYIPRAPHSSTRFNRPPPLCPRSTMPFNRLAVYGHRGWAASPIVNALERSGAPLKVIYRPGSDVANLAKSTERIAVDVEKEEDRLVSALRGVDILMCVPSQSMTGWLFVTTDYSLSNGTQLPLSFLHQAHWSAMKVLAVNMLLSVQPSKRTSSFSVHPISRPATTSKATPQSQSTEQRLKSKRQPESRDWPWW